MGATCSGCLLYNCAARGRREMIQNDVGVALSMHAWGGGMGESPCLAMDVNVVVPVEDLKTRIRTINKAQFPGKVDVKRRESGITLDCKHQSASGRHSHSVEHSTFMAHEAENCFCFSPREKWSKVMSSEKKKVRCRTLRPPPPSLSPCHCLPHPSPCGPSPRPRGWRAPPAPQRSRSKGSNRRSP